MSDIHIDVHHVTRVEGHGNIKVNVSDGRVEEVKWQVVEAPRFFEAMVVGRHCTELAVITSRICGICSIGHTFASLKATEAAFGIQVSEQTRRLREILKHGENLQSHVLHVCYLVLPDLFRFKSALDFAAEHKDALLLVTKLHRLANETCDIIGGRTTHPIRTAINGWTMLPTEKELEELKRRHEEALGDLAALADIAASVAGGFPDFVRETEYISLTHPDEYAIYDGRIKSSDVEEPIPVEEYERVVNEYVSPNSTAKYTKFNRASYMVGALARYNNNYTQLTPEALEVGKKLGLDGPNYNPFMNNAAQIVECVFSVQRTIDHIEWLLDNGLKEEDRSFEIKEGRGVGAVDVPRGVLFHDYTYDKNGYCVKANCVIPTNQNHSNIQQDFEEFVPAFLDKGEDELRFLLEMLVRAYDPCISCSAHFLDVEFVK